MNQYFKDMTVNQRHLYNLLSPGVWKDLIELKGLYEEDLRFKGHFSRALTFLSDNKLIALRSVEGGAQEIMLVTIEDFLKSA